MKTETKVDVLSAADAGSLYDASVKKIFSCKEIIVPFLQLVVPEFKDCSQEEILACLDLSSVSSKTTVSDTGTAKNNTDYGIEEVNGELSSVNEKLIRFDVKFLALNPVLSSKNKVKVNLHIDIEGQKSYIPSNPKYKIETRGMYYCARDLSSQIGVATGKTNYADLEKCYSIWICTEGVPKDLQNTVTMFSIQQTDVVGKADIPKEIYDLMTCIVIRRGSNSKEKDNSLFDFLNGLFGGNIAKLEKYSKIKWDTEFEEEVQTMSSYGSILYDQGVEQGYKEAILALLQSGMEPKNIAESLMITEERVREVAEEHNILISKE